MDAGPERRRIAGVFVGGASRRMGGQPKGWLRAPREAGAEPTQLESVIERTLAILARECDDVFLVGNAAAYAQLGLFAIDDAVDPLGARYEGPLAGLVALLERAGGATVIALACDMPYVTGDLVRRLLSFDPQAPIVAACEDGDLPTDPREDGAGAEAPRSVWSPLFARYDAARIAPLARAKLEGGERSLRSVLESVATTELPLTREERRALRDWDSPADVEDSDRTRLSP